jgi:cytochrome o ubiquinol oxidase subunit 3
MEAHDFATMAADHATPDRSGFLSAFFVLVGMHGLHVTIGSIWMIVMLMQVAMIGCDRRVKINLIRLSLFWHFLDVIWIAIFSIVYLQGLVH